MGKVSFQTVVVTAVFFMCTISLLFIFAGCSGGEAKPEPSPTPTVTATNTPTSTPTVTPTFTPTPQAISIDVSELYDFDNQGPEAHKQYLDEPMVFSEFDLAGEKLTSGKYAVVGSDKAKLFIGISRDDLPYSQMDEYGYPQESAMPNSPEVIDLPIGTLLPLISTANNSKFTDEETQSYYIPYFSIAGHFNYFYETEYQGQKGFVWGADLAGIKKGRTQDYDYLKKLSYYYSRKESSENFYPITGWQDIPEDIQTKLESGRVAFQKVERNEYYMDADKPDDLIALYDKSFSSRPESVFITTDLIIHCLHLVFDRMLSYAEEYRMYPKLLKLTRNLADQIQQKIDEDTGGSPKYTEALTKALYYFQVPLILLESAPKRVESSDYGRDFDYEESSVDISQYADLVQQEIKMINSASGRGMSPTFEYSEDYTQFKPRGHYTKNGILEAYFRAMMWYGRIHMTLADGPLATDHSLKMAPITIVVNEALEAGSLYADWENLFTPITYLIGESDDINSEQLKPLLEDFEWAMLPEWLSDPENIKEYITRCNQELPKPKIAGNSVFQAPSGDNRAAPVGYRLFGQRFTYDSFIHNQFSSPRLGGRKMVSGLDIMSVFGSKSAKMLLKDEIEDFPALGDRVPEFQKATAALDDDFWGSSFYNRYLHLVRSIAKFEQGSGFYFTETPVWNKKALLTAHGGWAELRHDTILYVKQSYSELAGGMDIEATYRIKELERPIHYVEPNIDFFDGLLVLIEDGLAKLSGTIMDNPTRKKFLDFKDIAVNLRNIVLLERGDEPISEDQNQYLTTLPRKLARLVMPVKGGGNIIEEKEMRMALVADVHTNAEDGVVLEVATGIPYRMYVALNDGQGGKRIARGYVYSYYEFPHPMSDRLNDDQWKQRVYKDKDVEGLEPFWSRDILQ